jgi:hypothetical protein
MMRQMARDLHKPDLGRRDLTGRPAAREAIEEWTAMV